MTRSRRIWILFPMLFGLQGILAGQAMIEFGLGASRASTGAAASKGISHAVGGVVDSLNKVLKTGEEEAAAPGRTSPAAGSSRARTARPGTGQRATLAPVAEAPPVPVKIYEDPMGIRAGMANDERVSRFGPPALEVTGVSGVRTMTYWGKNGIVQLDVRDEKVSRISAMKPEQAAVTLPSGQD